MPPSGVQSCGPGMRQVTSFVMPSFYKTSKEFCAPSVIEHGLLIGITFVLVSAAISLEALEILTGIVGALAVYVMKASSSRRQKCVDEPVVKPTPNRQVALSSRTSGSEIVRPTQLLEAKMHPAFAREVPNCGQEHAQLSACAHAELNMVRAESHLASWKLKVESKEAELLQLQAKLAELEKGLVQEETTETNIDAVLMNITETKLMAGEVEAELVQSSTKLSELQKEADQAFSMQMRAEESAQTSLEALSSDLMETNFQWTEESMEMLWPEELCEPLEVCGSDDLRR